MKERALFQPIQIGPMTVKNRFVMPPMANNMANTDGSLSEKSKAYYAARAKGGFGLITIEATVVDPSAKGGLRKSCLFDDSVIPSFAAVAEVCHSYGAKVSVQLQHAGAEGNAKAAGAPLKSASPIPAACGRDIPLEITREEIYALIERYGDAALRAKKANIDAVEIHCAHGYLLSSFLSPRTNKRVDEFGGSFENRIRIVKLILENIRKKAEGLAVLCRINCQDEMPGGLTVQDSAAIAAYLEELGVDALHISRAVHIKDEYMWAPTCIHGGFNADYVTEIKRAVRIPVMIVGRFTDPYYPELLVREGRADLIVFGRQSIADPELVNKIQEGRTEAITPCIACLQGCVANMYQGQTITCLANPLVGREAELTSAEQGKKVAVIGGGVGGLMAARICALRGHQVDLYEASDKLGGNMRIAAFPPGKGDISGMVRSFIVQCEKAGVRIHLNSRITEAMLKELSADAIILATGAVPFLPPIPGIENTGAVSASDVLQGKSACGRKVLIAGGGMIGCETADFLGELQHEVTVIELQNTVGTDMIAEHRKYVLRSLNENSVSCITGARISSFYKDGADYTSKDGCEQTLRGFDTVVLALGYQNYDPLSQAAKNVCKEVFVIGDAVHARRALEATREAFEAALRI